MMQAQLDPVWLNSTGGPLIFAETAIAKHWRGISGNSSWVSAGTTDYDRACQTSEYLEVLNCDGGEVLVLGDEPLQSTVLQGPNAQPFIVRWIYSSGSLNLEKFSNTRNFIELAPKTRFRVSTRELLLFDSSENLEEMGYAHLIYNLSVGLYDVTTEEMLIEGQHHFLIHRFLKLNE